MSNLSPLTHNMSVGVAKARMMAINCTWAHLCQTQPRRQNPTIRCVVHAIRLNTTCLQHTYPLPSRTMSSCAHRDRPSTSRRDGCRGKRRGRVLGVTDDKVCGPADVSRVSTGGVARVVRRRYMSSTRTIKLFNAVRVVTVLSRATSVRLPAS